MYLKARECEWQACHSHGIFGQEIFLTEIGVI